MFAGPFIRIHGNPLLLLNIVERKFVILGQIFWPQDMIIFGVDHAAVPHRASSSSPPPSAVSGAAGLARKRC